MRWPVSLRRQLARGSSAGHVLRQLSGTMAGPGGERAGGTRRMACGRRQAAHRLGASGGWASEPQDPRTSELENLFHFHWIVQEVLRTIITTKPVT